MCIAGRKENEEDRSQQVRHQDGQVNPQERVALVSPFLAYAAWYARGNGWIAACIAALPAALLLVEGVPFFYTASPSRGFDVLAAVFLLVVLSRRTDQKLRSLLVTATAFILFKQFHVISLVFGWIGA